MPITRNLRDLLSAPGNPPDTDNDLAVEILSHWDAQRDDTHVRSSDAPFYASDGAGCARAIAYKFLSRTIPDAMSETDPPGIADQWTFELGNTVHGMIQDVAEGLGFDNEVRAVLKDEDGNDLVSTRGDMYREADGTVVEIKSKNGFGFKKMATTFSGPPEGPQWGHVVQLALTVKALVEDDKTVDRAALLYLSLEKLSPSMARDFADSDIGRFAAQWQFTVEEMLDVADQTLVWLHKIKTKLEAGEMPPRVINDPAVPRQAVVENPASGGWVVRDRQGEILRAGSYWLCNYCDWRTLCLSDKS